MNTSDTLQILRQKHPRFIYETCETELVEQDLICRFHFRLESRTSLPDEEGIKTNDQNRSTGNDDIVFSPTITLHDVSPERFAQLDKELLHAWVFQIGMVELLSYWKAACSPEIVIKAGYLTAGQLQFWHTLLLNGMGEFFYLNNIDAWQKDFVRFVVEPTETFVGNAVEDVGRAKYAHEAEHSREAKSTYQKDTNIHAERCLVPIGGGKDSLVTLELLKTLPQNTQKPDFLTPFTLQLPEHFSSLLQVISQNIQKKNLSEVASSHNASPTSTTLSISVSRHIDPTLFTLNKQGYLNGHTPFSALLAFVSTLSAWIFDHHYVIVSNEQSANESNIIWNGHPINHQYSKSFAFEKDFRQYCHDYLSETIDYFSLLRPLHELKITQLFTHYPQYFKLFLSCNRGQKTGHWCGECPKCLFVFLMLSAFLSPLQVEEIFGQNILEKAELLPLLHELTGEVPCKSFECVGMREETLAALYLCLQQYSQEADKYIQINGAKTHTTLPFLLLYARDYILPKYQNLDDLVERYLHLFAHEHAVQPPFLAALKLLSL